MKLRNQIRHMTIVIKTFVFQCVDLAYRYRELIRYGIFGVLTTAVDYGVYALLKEILLVNETTSNAIAWLAAVLFAFVTNKLFVFGSKTRKATQLLYEFGTFLAARALTGAVYIGGFWICSEKLGINDYLTKALLSVFNIIVNYIFSKLITFRKKHDDGKKKEEELPRTSYASVKNGTIRIGAAAVSGDGEKNEGETNLADDSGKGEDNEAEL